MRTRSLPVALMAVALAAGSCGGGGGKAPKATPEPAAEAAEIPALERVWTTRDARLEPGDPNSTLPSAWTVGDRLVIPGRRAVTGLDVADGTVAWRRPTERVCAVAPRPNDAGTVAVMTGRARTIGGGCAAIVTLDAATGRRTGTFPVARLAGGREGYGLTDVAIGERAVVATSPCDAAYAFSLRTGRRVASLFPGGSAGGCVDAFASDGELIVRGDATDDDASRIVGYDAATGRERFAIPVRQVTDAVRPDPEVERVVGADPPVIDGSVNGDRFLRLLRPERRSQRPIGRETESSRPPLFTEQRDGRILIQYADSRHLFVLDTRTGEQVRDVPLASGETVVGLRGEQVISVGAPTTPSLTDVAIVARATDPETGARTVLGALRADGTETAFGLTTTVVAGDLLVVGSQDGVIAYRLPERGAPEAEPPGPAGAEDVTGAMTDDLCLGVTVATRRRLGFLDPDAPAPADCSWTTSTPNGGLVQLTALGFAYPSAQKAEAALQTNSARDEVDDLPAMRRVARLGDVAFTRSGRGRGERTVEYLAREGNAVVSVRMSYGTGYRGPPPPRLRQATRAAVTDLLAELERRR